MTEEFERYRRAQAAQWMEHVRGLGARVRSIKCEIDAQRDLATGLSSVAYDGLPRQSSSDGDAVPNAVIRIQGLIAEYCSELERYVGEQREAHEALSGLSDGACREALTRHYLIGKGWEECCVDMGYTWDGMMALRRRALSAAYDLMPARWRDPRHPAI